MAYLRRFPAFADFLTDVCGITSKAPWASAASAAGAQSPCRDAEVVDAPGWFDSDSAGPKAYARRHYCGLLGPQPTERAAEIVEERRRFNGVLEALGCSGSQDPLDAGRFVDFFRKAGMLLEQQS